MGFLILVIVGAVFGWLTTIILRIEDAQRIGWHAGIGIGGAVIAGRLVAGGSVIGSLSPLALLAGLCGSCVALFLYRCLQRTEIH